MIKLKSNVYIILLRFIREKFISYKWNNFKTISKGQKGFKSKKKKKNLLYKKNKNKIKSCWNKKKMGMQNKSF